MTKILGSNLIDSMKTMTIKDHGWQQIAVNSAQGWGDNIANVRIIEFSGGGGYNSCRCQHRANTKAHQRPNFYYARYSSAQHYTVDASSDVGRVNKFAGHATTNDEWVGSYSQLRRDGGNWRSLRHLLDNSVLTTRGLNG